jgi:hypothetical protein
MAVENHKECMSLTQVSCADRSARRQDRLPARATSQLVDGPAPTRQTRPPSSSGHARIDDPDAIDRGTRQHEGRRPRLHRDDRRLHRTGDGAPLRPRRRLAVVTTTRRSITFDPVHEKIEHPPFVLWAGTRSPGRNGSPPRRKRVRGTCLSQRQPPCASCCSERNCGASTAGSYV